MVRAYSGVTANRKTSPSASPAPGGTFVQCAPQLSKSLDKGSCDVSVAEVTRQP